MLSLIRQFKYLITNMNSKFDTRSSYSENNIFFILFIIIVCISLSWFAYKFFPESASLDWTGFFRPAIHLLLEGKSPYQQEGFYNPPWILIPFIPLALLPPKIGGAILFSLSFMLLVFLSYKLGAKLVTIVFIILSFPVAHGLYLGSLEPFIYLGLILPPQIGLFFLLAKPQIGFGVAIYWFFVLYKEGRIIVIKTFAPVIIVTLLSLIVFDKWILKLFATSELPWNVSLWPFSIPVGLIFIIASIYFKKPGYALIFSSFISPYVAPQTWSTLLIGFLPKQFHPMALSVGIWILIIYKIL
jgi:hypothetical protein